MPAYSQKTADAIAKSGIPMSADYVADADRLTPEREAEIREWVEAMGKQKDIRYYGSWQQHGELLGEIDRLRDELAKYVGHEPTIAEEMTYLSSCLNAVRDLCDATEKQATRWEHPLPVPEWVADVRNAADGERPDDPEDRRRRVYIDGEGEAWLSLSSDRGIRYIGKLAGAFDGDDTTDSVRERTGSLREIGRCW